MKLSRTHYLIAMALVIAAYVAIRCWDLTASCLWFDEIFGVHSAEHSWDTILQFVALDLIHPPLFYVLLKLWIAIGGESLFWLRVFPVVFSVLALVPFLALCRELKLDRPTTLLALFFLAVNGALTKYSQEVRMYSILFCLSLFSIWLFVRYFNKGKNLIPLLIVNVLLVYTHYFGWFVIGAEAAAILVFQRIKWRGVVTMAAVTLAAFTPWIVAVWNAARSGSAVGQNIGWMERPGIKAIIQFKLALIEPFYQALSSVDAASVYLVSIPLLLIFTVAIVMYAVEWGARDSDQKQNVYLLAIFAAMPVLAALAASWTLPYSIWGTRHLIVVFAPVSILLAVMAASVSNRAARTSLISLILLLTGSAFVVQARRDQPQFIWCAWEKVADDFIDAANKPPFKPLYVFEDLIAYHFWFELRNYDEFYSVSVIKGVDGVDEDPAYFLPRGFSNVKTVRVDEITENRVWIAFRGPPTSTDFGVSPPAPVRALEDAGYEREKVNEFDMGGQTAYLVQMAKRRD